MESLEASQDTLCSDPLRMKGDMVIYLHDQRKEMLYMLLDLITYKLFYPLDLTHRLQLFFALQCCIQLLFYHFICTEMLDIAAYKIAQKQRNCYFINAMFQCLVLQCIY